MRFLKGLTSETKAANPLSATSRAVSSSTSTYGGGGYYSGVSNWDVDKAVQDGYEKVSLVFRCVDAIASAQADTPIVVRKGNRYKGQIVEYSDVDRVLNFRSNNYEDAWSFRYRLSSQCLLSVRGAFIEIVPTEVPGGLAEVHLLPPGQVEPIPDPYTFVSGFKVNRMDGGIDILDPSRVIWVKAKPHPTDPYRQMTPLVAAGITVETDYFARVFNRNFLMNDGRPGLLVSINGDLNQQDAETIKRRFSGGYRNAGGTTVIEADGLDVADLAATPRDIQWNELLQGNKDDILLAFGTPESVLGNASGRTFDNADAERENWWHDTVSQHCNSITRNLDALLGNNRDDVITHDFSTVEVLQRYAARRLEVKAAEFAAGLCTLDDYLLEAGREILDEPASRVHFLPNGVVVGGGNDAEVAAKSPMIIPPAVQAAQQNQQAGVGALPTMPNLLALSGTKSGEDVDEAAQNALEGLSSTQVAPVPTTELKTPQNGTEGRFTVLQATKVMPQATQDPSERLRAELEGHIEGVLETWSDSQTNVALSRLDHVKVRKGTRHWDGADGTETKALDAHYVLELHKWSSDVHRLLMNRIRRAGMQEAKAVIRDAEANGITATFTDADLGMILSPVEQLIRTAANNQQLRIIKLIEQADAEGADIKLIKLKIKQAMSQRGSWHTALANAVTGQTLNGVRNHIYAQGGDKILKMWNCNHDEKTRESHLAADEQSVPMNKPFSVGGSLLMYPQDPRGPAAETIHCRCWVSYWINPEAGE